MKTIIRFVRPDIYKLDVTNTGFIVSVILLLAAAVIVSVLTARFAMKAWGGNKKKTMLCFAGITVCIALALICFFGFAAVTIKGIVLALILLCSSYEDIRKRECEDYLHLMIVIVAFIGTELSSLPNMLLSALFAGGILLAAAIVTKNGIGGADVKFSAACSFLLGLSRGVFGLTVGMLLAVAFNIFAKNKNKGFPMIPYLAVGYMAAYFLQS